MGVGLYNPYKFLHRMIKVEFHLVGCRGCALITCELELLDEIFMGNLCKATTFISIKVDVVDEQRSSSKRTWNNSRLGCSDGTVVPSTCEVTVSEFTEFKVDLDFMVLKGYEWQRESRVAVPNYLTFRLRCGLYLKQ